MKWEACSTWLSSRVSKIKINNVGKDKQGKKEQKKTVFLVSCVRGGQITYEWEKMILRWEVLLSIDIF